MVNDDGKQVGPRLVKPEFTLRSTLFASLRCRISLGGIMRGVDFIVPMSYVIDQHIAGLDGLGQFSLYSSTGHGGWGLRRVVLREDLSRQFGSITDDHIAGSDSFGQFSFYSSTGYGRGSLLCVI